MKRFKLTYRDCGEENIWRCSAFDREHAEDKFWNSLLQEGDEGIELLKIQIDKSYEPSKTNIV